MAHVRTQRLEVHYEEAGAGPDVYVLVHGNFASWRWWRPVFDRLPPGFHAYAPDLRGCGDTRGADDAAAYEIPALADDLLSFADAVVGPRAFHLVGHSLGGAVALQLAIAHPERVRTLTLLAPAPATGLVAMREGLSPSAVLLRAFNPDRAASMAVLHGSYALHHALGTNRLMLKGALAKMMPSAHLDGAEEKALLGDAARMAPGAVVGFLQALHRWNVADRLWAMHVPTLILAGGKDALVPGDALARTADLLPRGKLVVWPDVGHSPQVESPDAFVRLLASRRSLLDRARTWLWRAGQRLSGAPPRLAGGSSGSPAAVEPE